MSSRTIRVTVRGAFTGLTDSQRAALESEADQHDVMHAAFTPEGTITYDVTTRPFFTFRYQGQAATDSDIPAVTARARAACEQWLTTRGYRFGELTDTSVDMTQIPLGKRGRREAARHD